MHEILPFQLEYLTKSEAYEQISGLVTTKFEVGLSDTRIEMKVVGPSTSLKAGDLLYVEGPGKHRWAIFDRCVDDDLQQSHVFVFSLSKKKDG